VCWIANTITTVTDEAVEYSVTCHRGRKFGSYVDDDPCGQQASDCQTIPRLGLPLTKRAIHAALSVAGDALLEVQAL
jgi:hypothetical protein